MMSPEAMAERSRLPEFMRPRMDFFNEQARVVDEQDGTTLIPMNFPDAWGLFGGQRVSTDLNVGKWGKPPFDTGLYYEVLEPGKELRATASRLGTLLADITAPKVSRRKVKTRQGPGRAVPRTLVKMQQDARAGIPPDRFAKPYRRTQHLMTPRQPITCGVLVDESFSMDSVSRTAAATAWALSRAVQHAGGVVAQATFGFDAHPVIGPGETSEVYTARRMIGAIHQPGSGMRLLDAALDLIDEQGARLLVVFGDNVFEDEEFLELMLEFEDSGGAIFVVVPDVSTANYHNISQRYPVTARWIDMCSIPGISTYTRDQSAWERNVGLLFDEMGPMLKEVVDESLGL